MDEGVFMGAAKNILKISALRFVSTLLYRKFLWRNLNTGCKKYFLKITISSACLISEAGAA
jgi:hypothetical protein